MRHNTIDFTNAEIRTKLARAILENAPVACMIVDRGFKARFINDHFLKMRDVSRTEVLGNHCFHLYNSDRPCRNCNVEKVFATGEPQRIIRQNVYPDGDVFYFDDYAFPLKREDGAFDFVLEIMINRTNETVLHNNNQSLFVNIVESLVHILDKKDPYTSTHSQDVMEIAVKLGRRANLSERELLELRLASLLHDIGKVYVPDPILNKRSRLTDDEYDEIKRHPVETMTMLAHLSRFEAIRDIAGHHHERWDGNGYPSNLAGEDIPLAARIIALADTYDAMTSSRSYRPAMRHEQALREIARNSGTQFDPALATLFLDMATREYPTRESMIAVNSRYVAAVRPENRRLTTIRYVDTKIRPGRRTRNIDAMRNILASPASVDAILNNTPLAFAVLDNRFNILFASSQLASEVGIGPKKLRSMRCFEAFDGSVDCFATDNGLVKCPIVRAFQNDGPERELLAKSLFGDKRHWEVFAVPMDLGGAGGKDGGCVLCIAMDRTKEAQERHTMATDIRSLLSLLYDIVAETNDSMTQGGAVLEGCATIEEYLTAMDQRIARLTGSAKKRRETAQA